MIFNASKSPNRLVSRAGTSLLAALAFSVAALILAPIIGIEAFDNWGNREGRASALTIFLGMFSAGAVSWWLLVPRTTGALLVRAMMAGILAGLLAYPLVIGLSEFIHRGWTDEPGSFGERLERVIWVSSLALMTTGFMTVAIMALIGGAIAGILAVFVRTQPPVKRPAPRNRLIGALQWAAAILAIVALPVLAGTFLWLNALPVAGDVRVSADSSPAADFEEALRRFDAIRAEEATLGLHERCPSRLLDHGERTQTVVIFFHGLTSCPAQGEELAEQLFALGYTVLLPRMYGHGEVDPDTVSLSHLTAEHLIDLANTSIDLANGLGDRVVVTGLSAGGTIASWAAQNRADVELAVPASPFFGPYVLPPWATHAAVNLVLKLPDAMFWWNPLEPVTAPGTDYVFPRPSIHTLAQVMRLGRMVFAEAAETEPAATHIAVLLNDADVAVSNHLTLELVEMWRGHGRQVDVHSLPFSNHLPHDLINTHEIFGDIELVYTRLIDIIGTPPDGGQSSGD